MPHFYPERRILPMHVIQEVQLYGMLIHWAGVLIPQLHSLRQLHRLQQFFILNVKNSGFFILNIKEEQLFMLIIIEL